MLSSYKVFVVDDSEEDRFFMRKMLDRSPKLTVIGEACDGQELLDYLDRLPVSADATRPDILILDLKMPRKNGYDVLMWLKEQKIPNLIVIVTSGSCLPEDVNRSRELGAHSYFKKTSIRSEQDAILRELESSLEQLTH